MTVTFQSNIDAFNRALSDYLAVTKLSTQEATKKQAGNFALLLNRSLKRFTPSKGSIRKDRLSALKAGQGVKVRESVLKQVYEKLGVISDIKTKQLGVLRRGKFKRSVRSGGKRLSIQALAVKRELNLRESGRGFLPFSAQVRSLISRLPIKQGDQRSILRDRANRYLTRIGFSVDEDNSTVSFDWGLNKSSAQVAKTLNKPRQQQVIATALDQTRADMMDYIRARQARAKWKLQTI